MKKFILTIVLALVTCFALSSCGSYELAVEEPTARVVVSTYPSYYYYRHYFPPRPIYRRATPPPPPRHYNRPPQPQKPNVGNHIPPHQRGGGHRR